MLRSAAAAILVRVADAEDQGSGRAGQRQKSGGGGFVGISASSWMAKAGWLRLESVEAGLWQAGVPTMRSLVRETEAARELKVAFANAFEDSVGRTIWLLLVQIPDLHRRLN